jgi:hypothetical protein
LLGGPKRTSGPCESPPSRVKSPNPTSATHSGSTEDERAFRRERVLAALTQALHDLRLRQIMAEIEAAPAKASPSPNS